MSVFFFRLCLSAGWSNGGRQGGIGGPEEEQEHKNKVGEVCNKCHDEASSQVPSKMIIMVSILVVVFVALIIGLVLVLVCCLCRKNRYVCVCVHVHAHVCIIIVLQVMLPPQVRTACTAPPRYI